jgi:hypothetical protein
MAYGFGTGSYGTMALGTEQSAIDAIRQLVALTENRIRVGFDIAPLTTNLGFAGEVYRVEHYIITPDETSLSSTGEPPRAVAVALVEVIDSHTIDLILDRPMSSFPARYIVSVEGLETSDGDLIESESQSVLAVFRGIAPKVSEFLIDNRDIAISQGGRA